MVKVGSMRRANRFLLIASMLVVVASGADASLWRRHKSDAAAPSAPSAPAKGAPNADPAAMSLLSIDSDASRVVLHTSGTPAYTSYSPTPDVFVVDLTATSKGSELKIPAALPSGVASIAAEDAVEMGNRLTRITFRLSQLISPTASAGENSVVVTLPSASAAQIEEPAAAPVVTNVPVKIDTPAEAPHVEAIAENPHVDDAPAVTTEALPSTPAKRLKNIETHGSAVRLTGDGEIQYKAFRLNNPERVVLDLNGVRNTTTRKTIPVSDSVVKRVRVAQFAPDVTRVVMDLDSNTAFNVSREGDHLLVTFGGAATPAFAAVPAISDEPKPVAIVETPKRETPKPAAARPVPVVDIPSQVPAVAENAPTWKMPEHASKGAKSVITAPADQAQPETTTTKRKSRNLNAPVTTPTPASAGATAPAPSAEDVFNDQATASGGSTTTLSGTLTGTRMLSPTGRVYTGEPISLNLKDADIKDVLRTFAQLTGLNIAVDPGIKGDQYSVTVDFVDVPWDQALDLILRQNGLTYVLEGNVMRVGTIGRISEETTATRRLAEEERLNVQLQTVSFKLSYARAGEVAGLMGQLASPRARIIVDSRTNQIIISEIPQYLQTMRNLIDSIDVPTKQVTIEARIVETTKNFLQQYGFTWGFRGSLDPALGTGTGLVFPNNVGIVGGPFNFGPGNPIISLTMTDVLGTFNLDLALNAAEAEGLVKVISAPKVTTQDNQSAEIQSGFQIPYQTRVNFTTTVTYVDATLRLSVTPQITEAGTVIMEIAVQKNEPATGLAVEGGAGTPLSTRQARTRLMVRDGGTSVIAGIYQTKDNNSQTRLPFLHQIPVIGNLFKTHNVSSVHDELLIFITPRIVRGS
jgi:type IV pilus secretin PilQ/predicted competence protein